MRCSRYSRPPPLHTALGGACADRWCCLALRSEWVRSTQSGGSGGPGSPPPKAGAGLTLVCWPGPSVLRSLMVRPLRVLGDLPGQKNGCSGERVTGMGSPKHSHSPRPLIPWGPMSPDSSKLFHWRETRQARSLLKGQRQVGAGRPVSATLRPGEAFVSARPTALPPDQRPQKPRPPSGSYAAKATWGRTPPRREGKPQCQRLGFSPGSATCPPCARGQGTALCRASVCSPTRRGDTPQLAGVPGGTRGSGGRQC